MLAYGWVEHCSDVAGCGASSPSKIIYLDYYISKIILMTMNYDEYVNAGMYVLLPLIVEEFMHPCMMDFASGYASCYALCLSKF